MRGNWVPLLIGVVIGVVFSNFFKGLVGQKG